MKVKWNRFSAMERASIIGGLFALFTAIVIPCINYLKTDTIDLRITDIRIIQIAEKLGIEVIFWNKSDLPISVTSIDLSLKTSDSRREPFGQSIYHVNANIHIFSKTAGHFVGESIPDTSEIPGTLISYPISGNFYFSNEMENWSMYLNIPVREEIMSGKNQSIVIKLPDSINIVEEQQSELQPPGASMNTKELLFSKVIKDSKEPIQASVSVVYANKKISKAKTSLR